MKTARESQCEQTRRVVRSNMTALLAATFLLLQVLCQVFAAEGSGCELPSGYVTHPEYNAAYKIHRDGVRWSEARDRCVAEGAHLAVITSIEQIHHVVDPTILDSEVFLHIGIYRSTTTGPWVRIDNGLPITSIPWRGSNDAPLSNCAVVWKYGGGSFVDRYCISEAAFICEKSLAAGCPGPVGHQDSQGTLASKGNAE